MGMIVDVLYVFAVEFDPLVVPVQNMIEIKRERFIVQVR
jgi:hypothetical protein